MIRKRKLFARPMKPFEAVRIKEENVLVEKYGLKNKREVWKTLAKVNYFRRRAMELAKESREEQEAFFAKLKALGLNVSNTSDVLGLKVENLLDRRLPTIVAKKKIAHTVKEARQMVFHKRILVDNKIVNAPSYLVPVSQEDLISLKQKKVKEPKQEEVTQENKEEVVENVA